MVTNITSTNYKVSIAQRHPSECTSSCDIGDLPDDVFGPGYALGGEGLGQGGATADMGVGLDEGEGRADEDVADGDDGHGEAGGAGYAAHRVTGLLARRRDRVEAHERVEAGRGTLGRSRVVGVRCSFGVFLLCTIVLILKLF